jgi:STE24 endopeptidase
MNEDKASRYHRLRRRASALSACWTSAFLVGLLLTGASHGLRDVSGVLADRFGPTGGSPALAQWLYVLVLMMAHETGGALVALRGLALERRYGLFTESVAAWWADRAKSFAVVFIMAGAGAGVVHWTMGVAPAWWWLLSALLAAGLLVVAATVAPIVLLPLFYRIEPLSRESLRARLVALAARAGTRVFGAYQLGVGRRTGRANAALAGLGSSRRMLISDTLVRDYSDEEIEVVMAHEMGHHVHGDLWKGLAFEGAVLAVGFYAAAWAIDRAVASGALLGTTDLAGLPLVVMAVGSVSLACAPAAHAWSRARERSADRYALALTKNPAAFVSAVRRLGAQNLAEEEPSALVRWLFHSHPPVPERIAAAQASAAEPAAGELSDRRPGLARLALDRRLRR